MHFYSESFESVMKLPLKTFWMLSNNIDRIQAQMDLRTLQMNMTSGFGATAESFNKIYQALIAETGEIVKTSVKAQINAPRDYEGFEELRAMAKR